MANPKFKDQLVENVATLVTIVERGNVSQGNFGTTHWHKISVNGQMFDHGASDAEMKALGLLNVREEVQVVKKKNSFGTMSVFWSPKDGVEARANANPQPMGNTAMAKQDKQIDEYKSAQDEKGIAISLQGYHQQILPVTLGMNWMELGFKNNEVTHEQLREAALKLSLELASKAREAILKAAKEIHLGIPSVPPQNVSTLAEANTMFGQDTQATL